MTAVAGRTSHRREPVAAFGHVTAVLVSHDGAGWLPQVVAALGSQTRLPDAWVAVDTGSSDDSPRLLTDALGPDHVVEASADTAYATAVALGLEHRPPPGDGWIWLLHDDSAPAPGALEALLDEAASASDIAVVGAKTREWPSLRRLLEVGVTLSGTGRRETGLEPGEPDQGQHDRPRDVLAVGTAGMLVRADVWRALGGLDPAFGLGDDLDLGWRVARAGQRVRIAPEAVVFHVEAAARDRRTTGALRGPARRERRRAALLVLLANCRRAVLPVQLVRLFAGSLLRALGLLLLKAPRDAWAELRAVAGVYARPLTLWRARRARRRTATVGAGEVRHLLPPVWAPYRSGIARVAEVASAVLGSSPAAVPRGTASESGPVAEEAEVLPSEPGLMTRLAARPLATTSAVLLLLTLLALRGLLTGGELQGGALLPAPNGSGVWWAEYLASWHPVGVGSTAVAPPYALLLAGLGVLTLGDAGALVSLLLVLAVPASALSAHLLLRRLGVAAPARLWASFAYAGLPLLTGALAQGRLGTVLATAWLPVVATAVLGLARSRPDAEGGLQLWTRRMRAGLALGILVALVPVAYLLALVVAVGLLVGSLAAAPALRPASAAVSGAVVLAVPWLVAPWWLLDRMRNPANWFWEAGLPDADVGSVAPSVAGLVLGQPAGGTVGLVGWLGAGVVLAALLALVRTDSRPTVAGAWCVAAAGLVLATVGAGRTVDLPGGPAPVWVGFCLVVWWGGLLVAAAAAARDLREQLSGRSFGWRQPTVVAVAVAAVVGPPLALAVQVAEGVDGPLHRAAASPLPSYLVDDASTGRHTATLLVDGSLADGLGLTLVREDGWRLGEEPFIGAAGSATVSGALRDLLVSPQTDSVRTLARWAIGYLYVPGPVDPDVAAALDTAPGLVRSGASTGDRAWQLDQLVGQVQSLDAGDDAVGKGVPLQSAGADGGPPWEVLLPKPRPAMVSLAAAPDDGWRASLGGTLLRSTDAADVQAFSLGTATGGAEELDLVIEHRTARPWWVAAQIAALVVVVVLAAPTRGRRS